ncbi:MAG: sulfotransferase family 2 domain-containing protein [Alphaproteobacteria bacterium]|nr:sulfotransferase family 2 domain-containing protein [Alphaproteobacteria bacterium]
MTVQYAAAMVLDKYPAFTLPFVMHRLRYSTFVNLPRRFMYFEVPKAGCTTIKSLLRELEGAPPLRLFSPGFRESRRDMFVHARENIPLPSLVELDDATQREVLESPDFLRMVVVRNPYTRLFSAWTNKVMLCEPGYERVYQAIRGSAPAGPGIRFVTFPEFVDHVATEDLETCDPHWSLQTTHTFLSAFDFNLVGKLEQLSDCLARFAQHVGGGGIEFGARANASEGARLGGYDEDVAAKVYSLYRADFDRLGYGENDWPRQPGVESAGREKKLFEDVLERNQLISELYSELERARVAAFELNKVKRFHLLTVANGLLTAGELASSALSRVRRARRAR